LSEGLGAELRGFGPRQLQDGRLFFFGGARKGKRGRGAAGELPVFGVLKRGGKIDAVTMLLGPVLTSAPATSNTPSGRCAVNCRSRACVRSSIAPMGRLTRRRRKHCGSSGAKVIKIGVETNGFNINFEVGSTTPEALARKVREMRAASEVRHRFEPAPQMLRNARFKGGRPLENPSVAKSIADATAQFGQRGRLLVPPSGAQLVIRVMGEADDPALIDAFVTGECRRIKPSSHSVSRICKNGWNTSTYLFVDAKIS
jgi:hypothetical protein